MIESGRKFTIKDPSHASMEQVDYIKNYTEKIDAMIMNGEPDFEQYIDLESFAKKFVIDEISFHADINVTSMYYFKDDNSDKLYAGPVWDVDASFSSWGEPTLRIIIPQPEDRNELRWNAELYANELFKNTVMEEYQKFLPYMYTVLYEKIDEYAAYIERAVYLDDIRWKNSNRTGHFPKRYENFESDVQDIKYYLVTKLNYLNSIWGNNCEDFVFEGTGEMHRVDFVLDGNVVETRFIKDGDMISQLPELDENTYTGWYFQNYYRISKGIPVFEDYIFYAKNS